MFDKIQNPKTGRWVKINSKLGKKILSKYSEQVGGWWGCVKPNLTKEEISTWNPKERGTLCKQNQGRPVDRFQYRQPCVTAVVEDPTICNGPQEQKPAPASSPSPAPRPAPAHSQHTYRPHGQGHSYSSSSSGFSGSAHSQHTHRPHGHDRIRLKRFSGAAQSQQKHRPDGQAQFSDMRNQFPSGYSGEYSYLNELFPGSAYSQQTHRPHVQGHSYSSSSSGFTGSAHSQQAHRPYGQAPVFDRRLYDIFPEAIAAPSFSGNLGRNPRTLVFSSDEDD